MSSSRLTFSILVFLILYSSLQFLLILRHKSPYLSDSYFYKQIAYQFSGDSYKEAKEKVRGQIDHTKQDKITLNIFFNDKAYDNSYTFFKKRPLYPLAVSILSKAFKNEELAMLLPVFLSYLGTVIVFFVLACKHLNKFFAFCAVFMFVSFYPFLDWSTYYLTDTIGAFFWMMQIFFAYKFINEGNNKWLINLGAILFISLLNREQSILTVVTFLVALPMFKMKKIKKFSIRVFQILLLTSCISVIYLVFSFSTAQKTLLDTIIYTMNSYGLNNSNFTPAEVAKYLLLSYKMSHIHLLKDLVSHHLWVTIFLASIVGLISSHKKLSLISILMLASALASYLAIFLYPVLSYRYFFPVVMTICYFFAIFIKEFFYLSVSDEKK